MVLRNKLKYYLFLRIYEALLQNNWYQIPLENIPLNVHLNNLTFPLVGSLATKPTQNYPYKQKLNPDCLQLRFAFLLDFLPLHPQSFQSFLLQTY